MRIRVLGSAAGGGFPQWNCSCANCNSVRQAVPGFKARTQSQLAISDSSGKWHLLNGSPDLRQQLLTHSDMLPPPSDPRSSPIQSMTITNADVDHTLGLLLMREFHRVRVNSSAFVRTALLEGNAYFGMLQQFEGQCDWRTLEPGQEFDLTGQEDLPNGLRAKVYDVGGSAPYWAKEKFGPAKTPVIGLTIESAGGGRLGYFPSIGKIDAGLIQILSGCDAIFFDGTFWQDDELPQLRGGGRTALQMGHVPLSGPQGSLEGLKTLSPKIKKYFVHINNTNPALNENGVQYRQLRDAGWDLAYDGMEIQL